MKRAETPTSRALVLGVLWVAYLLNYVDRQMAFTWFPVLRHDVGFSDTQLGLIGSVFLWTYSVCAPFGGRICDRYSRRAIITASIAGWSLATIGTGLSRSPGTFLFWRGVVGFTEGFYYPAAVSTLVQVFGNALRGRAIALHGIAQFAGITLGGWLGGLAADRWGWRSACFAVGVCGFLYSPIVRGGLRGVREQQTGSGRYALANLRWSTCLSAIGASFFLICAMLWMLYAWLPDVIHSRFSLSLASSGLNATLVLQLSSMTGLLSGGAIGDWGRERHVEARGYMVAIGLLLCSPFAWLCFSATSLPMLWFAEAAFGLTSGLMLSNVVAGAYDLVPESQYGTIAGLMTLIGGLGGGLSMLATGVWLKRSTPDVLMRWTSLAGIIAAILLAIVVAKRFSIEAAESPSG
jgi:MFS family permease